MAPEGLECRVLYRDALMIVIDMAHRLDRDTSGCLVLGRHRKALAHLGALFKHGRVGKTYWAVVEGGPDAHEGEIDLPLGRLDATRGWWMKPDAKGLPALTKWRVLGGGEDSTPPGAFGATLPLQGRDKTLTWLALEPVTGRTHQLRVHCAARGWPIVGDAIYGSAPRHGGPGLHLHAAEVVVPLYPRREPIRVIAPVPEHMRELLMRCGWKEAP